MKISLLCQILSSLHLWHNWLRPSLQFIMRTKKDIFWPPLRPPADLQDGRGWGDLLPQLKDAAVAVKKVIIYLNWVFNTYTPKADQKNFRWYLKDSHRFSASMAPLTPDILILLHQQRKGFQRKWSHFPGSGRQSQIMQTTIRCHCHTATTPQPQICPREKNLPEKKQMPKEIKIAQDKKCLRKKTTKRWCCPCNHTSAANIRTLVRFIQKVGFHYKALQKKR